MTVSARGWNRDPNAREAQRTAAALVTCAVQTRGDLGVLMLRAIETEGTGRLVQAGLAGIARDLLVLLADHLDADPAELWAMLVADTEKASA